MSLYLSAKQFGKFVFEHTRMLRASKKFKIITYVHTPQLHINSSENFFLFF